jgi:hypothetical protein
VSAQGIPELKCIGIFTGVGLVTADYMGLGVTLASTKEFVCRSPWKCGGGQKRELADLHGLLRY